MQVVVDTNIVLDVILDRAPFAAAGRALWERVVTGHLEGYLVSTTLTNIFYIVRKSLGSEAARMAVNDLMTIFGVAPVDRLVLSDAVSGPIRDFEDAVQDAAAERAGIAVIVTRDRLGFAASTRRVLDVDTLIRELDMPSPPANP